MSKEISICSRWRIASCFIGIVLSTLPAWAEEQRPVQQAPSFPEQGVGPSDWSVKLGTGVMAMPEYEGSEEYRVLPLPFIDVRYKDRVQFNLRGAQINLLNQNGWTLGSGVGANFGRDEDDGDLLNGLGDIDATLEGQLFASYRHQRLSAGVTFAHDLGGGHEGYTIKGEAGYALPIPSWGLMLRPSISATYASDDYMASYFGVNATQSIRSGLNLYETGAGLKDVSVNFLALYQLSERWALNYMLQYKHLIGDAADSPIVEQEGQFSGGVFLVYQF